MPSVDVKVDKDNIFPENPRFYDFKYVLYFMVDKLPAKDANYFKSVRDLEHR